MNKLLNHIKNLDKQPASFDLNFQGIEVYQSQFGGFCSFLYILLSITIFTLKSIDLIQLNHIDSSLLIKK